MNIRYYNAILLNLSCKLNFKECIYLKDIVYDYINDYPVKREDLARKVYKIFSPNNTYDPAFASIISIVLKKLEHDNKIIHIKHGYWQRSTNY